MKYTYRRLRSWWYWRQFDSPGKNVNLQLEFARDNLPESFLGGWT